VRTLCIATMKTTTVRPVVCIIHTSFVSVTQLTELFAELAPEAQVRNIVDDTLLPEVLANRGVTPRVRSRMCEYYKAAELAGAHLIFNQCSSVGEVADLASTIVNVPVIKVDARMAEVACHTGPRIGVVATLETTLGPTCRLIESTAARLGAKIELSRCLVDGAFDQLIQGDRTRHNQMVLDAIRDLSQRVDVIVCAQGSMMAIVPELGPTAVPVLTSPRLGVQSAAEWLARRPERLAPA
jgi:aspartate/glutamate racemase